jgi:hypothetical protein
MRARTCSFKELDDLVAFGQSCIPVHIDIAPLPDLLMCLDVQVLFHSGLRGQNHRECYSLVIEQYFTH